MSIPRTFHIWDITLENQRKTLCHLTWMVSWPNQPGQRYGHFLWAQKAVTFQLLHPVYHSVSLPLPFPLCWTQKQRFPFMSLLKGTTPERNLNCIKGKDTRQAASSNSVCSFAVTRNSCSEMPLFIEINFNIYNQLYSPVWKPLPDLITVSTAAVVGEGFLVSLLIPSYQNFLTSCPVMQQKQKENGLSERVCFSTSSSWFLKVFPKSGRSCLSAWPSGTQLSGWICSKGLSWQKVLK